MIKFLVKGQNIETLEHEIIAADQVSFVVTIQSPKQTAQEKEKTRYQKR